MFGWFKRKPRLLEESNEVYQSRSTADAALVRAARPSELPVIVASFFPDSLERVEGLLRDAGVDVERWSSSSPPGAPSGSVLTLDASRLSHDYAFDGWLRSSARPRSFLFVEHHPLLSTERVILDVLDDVSKSHLHAVRFFVALDDPMMRAFGGDRMSELMQRLGMGPEEAIRHTLVDRSIQNAQERLGKRAPNATPTRSVEEWFAQNLVGK